MSTIRLIISFPSRASFLFTTPPLFIFSCPFTLKREGFYECVCVFECHTAAQRQVMEIVIIAVVLSDVVSSGIINVRMGTGGFLGATPAFTMCFFSFPHLIHFLRSFPPS